MNIIKKIYPSLGKFSLWAAGVFFGIYAKKLTEHLPAIIILPLLIIFSALGLFYSYITSKVIEPGLKARPLKDETDEIREARKGLIVFLPLYKNFLPNKKFNQEQLETIIKERNYKALDLKDTTATNFGHVINAINAHKSKLKHLWIITSKAPLQANAVTSLAYKPVFEEFFEKEINTNKNISLHFDKEYSVDITETSAITQRTYELIRDIYKEAKSKYNLEPKDLIADVTGGFVFMSVGTVLASLAKEQDIQVNGCEYDPTTGNPVVGGKSYPVRIGYAPHIPKS